MNILQFLHPKSTIAFLYDSKTLRQGLEKMKAHGYTALPVISKEGSYVGTVSEGDFLWNILETHSTDMKQEEKLFVKDILRPKWNPAVKINVTMDDLLLCVMDQNFVPVVDDRGYLMGIITRKDIIKYYYDDDLRRKRNQSHPV